MCFWFVLRTTYLYKLFVYYTHLISSNANLRLEARMTAGPVAPLPAAGMVRGLESKGCFPCVSIPEAVIGSLLTDKWIKFIEIPSKMINWSLLATMLLPRLPQGRSNVFLSVDRDTILSTSLQWKELLCILLHCYNFCVGLSFLFSCPPSRIFSVIGRDRN